MELAEDGTQPYVQGRMKPAELFRRLTSGKPKQWEAVFKAVIKPECGGLCVLECKRCKADVSPINPSQAAQRHKCTAAALAAAGVRSSPRKQQRGEQEEDVDEIGRPAKKGAIERYTTTAAQYKEFHRLFAIHIVKAEVPFIKVECPALRWVPCSINARKGLL